MLEQLELSESLAFGDDALKALLPIGQLRRLDVHQTSVTDEGVKELIALPNLRALDVKGTAVTVAGVQFLRDRQVDIRIDR